MPFHTCLQKYMLHKIVTFSFLSFFSSIGFKPKLADEWNAGNRSQGCVRNPPLGCQVNKTGDGFLSIPNVKWPDFSYWVSGVTDEYGCMNTCQQNCSCGAYVYMTQLTGCLHWGSELMDVYQFQAGGYALNLKLPASELGK